MPEVVNKLTVLITTPTGQANVPNPLLYKLQQYPLNSILFPDDYPGDGVLNFYPTSMRPPYNETSNPD
jgi:hypothetical protein